VVQGGGWSFKLQNNGEQAWPASTIVCLDQREDLVEDLKPVEIHVGAVKPKAIFTISGIDL
jgi:hypothetical protein